RACRGRGFQESLQSCCTFIPTQTFLCGSSAIPLWTLLHFLTVTRSGALKTLSCPGLLPLTAYFKKTLERYNRNVVSGRLAVAHDGKKRIHVFGPSGGCLWRFGERGDAGNDIKYPLDVTVASDGHVVVTDGGDRSVKAFDFEGRGVLAVREGFRLPWGLDATPEGEVILTDSEAGALYRLTADFKTGRLKKCGMIRSQLVSPRGVAVCQTSGAIAVIEHLKAQGPNGGSTRVKIFSAEMDLVGQVDSFGLNLVFPSRIYATAVAFDKEGRVIVTDVCSQAVICLGNPKEFPIFNPLISHGLSYPVGLTYTANDSLVVLDSGDHSVKIYSST
uniref:NHL repeat containing E3 ubiquitin protein ligase 1 n=1 Tax=Buteo japonicus TaxID=224669 RepID=A0A8C0BLM9_9AVES